MKIVKVKCDCCGKMFDIKDLHEVVAPTQEFDGLACEACEKELMK